MNEERFEGLLRGLGGRLDRRRFGGLAAGALAAVGLGDAAGAKPGKKKKPKKCGKGKTRCGKACVNLHASAANCGRCGHKCPSGQGCRNGTCQAGGSGSGSGGGNGGGASPRFAYDFQWGGPGSASGQFNGPMGVALDAAGNVYVAERGNIRVQVFSSEGGFLRQKGVIEGGETFRSPFGVAVAGDGTIYVSDQGLNRFVIFENMSSESFYTFVLPFATPLGVAADGGFVYVATAASGTILKYTPDFSSLVHSWGGVGTAPGQFRGPVGVAVGGGAVYVADQGNNRIQKFDTDGRFLRQWGRLGAEPGQFSRLQCLALDAAGNVYAADYGNNRVQVFDPNGAFLTQFGGPEAGAGDLDRPVGLAVDRAGRVYVSEEGGNRIARFDPVAGTRAARTAGGRGGGRGADDFEATPSRAGRCDGAGGRRRDRG